MIKRGIKLLYKKNPKKSNMLLKKILNNYKKLTLPFFLKKASNVTI